MDEQEGNIKFKRVWAMPSAWTFTIPPIRQIVSKYVGDGKEWIDPFAGKNSPAEITNDLNPERKATHNMDALEFLKSRADNSAIGVLYDPPYSFTQAKECYEGVGADQFEPVTSMKYWADCKKHIGRIVKPGGIVICCGWNSNGIGHNRGYQMIELLCVPHGGSKNDTMVTVERRFTYDMWDG